MLMETRMERNRKVRKEKRKKGFKSFVIIFMIIALVAGVVYVNKTMKDYGLIDNPKLFSLDFKNNILTFLGEKYYFDLKILKKH